MSDNTLANEAGKPHPEALNRHEPLINRRFIEIFDHPDNADIVRSVNVGLAINDAPRPVEPPKPKKKVTADSVRYTDPDGDVIKIRRVDDDRPGKELHGFLFDIEGKKVFMLDTLDGDVILEWLNRRFGGKK
jgi:hypothetical protein